MHKGYHSNKVTSPNGDLGVFIRRQLRAEINVHIMCTTQNEAGQTTTENYETRVLTYP